MNRMPLLVAVLLLAAAVGLAQPADAEDGGPDTHRTRLEAVDQYFSELAEQGMFNGNLLIALDRQEVLLRTYNIEQCPDEMGTAEDDQFVIASVAKLLVKYVTYMLAEQGQLSLSTEVSRWIDGLPHGGRISVGQLLEHTSGLPRELEGVDGLSRVSSAEFRDLASREDLMFEPGTDTLYSNVGYQLLAEVLSAVSEESYDQTMHRYLTGPAGMTDTAELLSHPPERLAPGFEVDDGRIQPGDDTELGRFRYLRIYSTVSDLHRFAMALFDPDVTPSRVTEQMIGDGEAVIHAGAMEGYRAYFYANPKSRVTFIFLSNFENIPFVRITEDVPKILAGDPYEVPTKPQRVAMEVAPGILARYVGRYALDLDTDQVFEIQAEGARLIVVDNDGERSSLSAETESTFFADPASNETVGFVLDERSGRWEMFLILEEGVRLETSRLDE